MSTSPSPRPAEPAPKMVVHVVSGPVARFFAWTGWLAATLLFLIVIVQISSASKYYDTTGGIEEQYHSLDKYAGDKIAIITVSGVILEGEGFVKKQIDRVRNDENVKAVVVRVDSPGGTVTGSDYIYHYLTRLREERDIPLVVSMGSVAASGGYYLSMAVGDQEDSIYAEPTTTTGSIGVIIPHYDLSGLLARFDVKDDSIASHERKQMLSMTKPMSPDDEKVIRAYLNEAFTMFKDRVKAGRPAFRNDESALDQLATGEIFTAAQAERTGLVDKIGFLEDAIDRAIALAKLDKDDVRVVKYKAPASFLDLASFESSSAGRGHLAALMELATPRAYYLSTTLPLLLSVPMR
jgi:protease-4